MIKLVIFDLDGTLINSIADLATAANFALSNNDIKGHSVEDYTKMVGHGVRKMIENALEKSLSTLPQPEFVDKVLADFTAYYVEHIDVHTKPYPGMVELLKELASNGVKLAVASNKFQAGAEKLVYALFPDVEFVSVLGNKEGLPLKPSAEVVELILAKSGVQKGECMFVGDSATDVKTAHNAGVPCVGVTWGFRPQSDLEAAGAEHIAKNAAELAALLLES